MKVFDMAKILPKPGFREIIISESVQDAIVASDDVEIREFHLQNCIYGISIHVEDDPTKRKMRAMVLSSLTGREVLYEGEDGEWLVASMPKADSPFRIPIEAWK